MGSPYEKKYIELTQDDRDKVTAVYHNWQQEGYESTYENVPEFCYSAGFDEDKIAEDEIVPIEYTKEYKVTNLLAEDNSIIVDGKNAEIERATLDSTIYTYNSVEYDEEATATENGEVTGTAHKDMKDISYYYDVKKLNVTGEVYDGNAAIKVGTKEIIKTTDAARTVKTLGEVSYNKSLLLTIAPANGYTITGVYVYKGDKLNGDYSKDDGERLSTVTAKTYRLADS